MALDFEKARSFVIKWFNELQQWWKAKKAAPPASSGPRPQVFPAAPPPILISHWNQYLEGFQYSAQEFYNDLKQEIETHGIPGLQLYQTSFSTGGMLSPRRLYLRVERKSLSFDICAAPFGQGYFFSLWYGRHISMLRRFIRALPFIGRWLDARLDVNTYYALDSQAMFLAIVRNSVTKTVNRIAETKGFRSLSDAESKPMMEGIFAR